MKVFYTDMRKNVWMSLHNRLKDSLIIDRSFKKFVAFSEYEFNFGAEFRAKFARCGQSLSQLAIFRSGPGNR
jgi:Leu/Phe-tRNA-protein transferase